MIHLKIIDSQDLMAIGDYPIGLHHVVIGKNLGATIPINDPNIQRDHIIFRLNSSNLVIQSKNIFTLNNKNLIGTSNLQIGDEIKIGSTIIKVINFDLTKALDPNKYYEAIDYLDNNDPKFAMFVEKLELLYVDLTSEVNE